MDMMIQQSLSTNRDDRSEELMGYGIWRRKHARAESMIKCKKIVMDSCIQNQMTIIS